MIEICEGCGNRLATHAYPDEGGASSQIRYCFRCFETIMAQIDAMLEEGVRQQVMSYGGGVNSIAMLAMVGMGKLPPPDIIIFADTGREGTATLEYLEEVARPYAAKIGLEITIAPHSLAKVDLYAHNGDLLLPMYTQSGKLPVFCSNEWKQYVVSRQLRAMGVKQCDLWIGYSLSEVERVAPGRLKWQRRIFPLLDNGGYTRHDCKTIIESAGLPLPAKSACWMCPNRTNKEWRFLRDNYPDDWQNAIDLERHLREKDSDIWLHRSAVTIGRADISQDNHTENTQCGLGMCFV